MPVAHTSQHVEGAAALDHEVLGDHLDEVDVDRRSVEEVSVVRLAKPQSESMHGCQAFGAVRLPPCAVQAFAVRSLKPWPLQSFIPLQSCLPDLQSDMPLHELTP